MKKHIIDDAKRCLQCKNPRCSQGCPVGTPIRDAIRSLLDSNMEDAGKALFENNPLSIICCHVCPQENQCEGHCVLNRTGSPVQISAIEQYISDFYLNIYKPEKSSGTAGKVAIIGSGPAGITITFELLKLGYDITIYEGNDQIGGVLRYGIPEFRLPKKYLDRLSEILVASGVKIRPNTTIGANLTVDDLFRDGFDAVFIGTGVWKPSRIDLPGESLGHVHYAIEYLRNPNVYQLGQNVIVVGAGNVAMDVARTAIRYGSTDVTIFAKRDKSSAREVELQYALIDGARIVYNKVPVRFTEEGAYFADSVQGENPENLPYVPGTETLYPADSIIIAIGQKPRAVIVSATPEINITGAGLLAVDELGRTSKPGVFASGDVVTGAKTVVEAVKVSKSVASEIDRYVKNSKKP